MKSLPDVPDPLLARFFGTELRAIMDLDPDDKLKVRGRFEQILADEAYEREMQKLARESDWGGMIALTDRHIETRKLEGPALQGALLNRAGLERRAGKVTEAEATLRRVVSIDPVRNSGRSRRVFSRKRKAAWKGRPFLDLAFPPGLTEINREERRRRAPVHGGGHGRDD